MLTKLRQRGYAINEELYEYRAEENDSDTDTDADPDNKKPD